MPHIVSTRCHLGLLALRPRHCAKYCRMAIALRSTAGHSRWAPGSLWQSTSHPVAMSRPNFNRQGVIGDWCGSLDDRSRGTLLMLSVSEPKPHFWADHTDGFGLQLRIALVTTIDTPVIPHDEISKSDLHYIGSKESSWSPVSTDCHPSGPKTYQDRNVVHAQIQDPRDQSKHIANSVSGRCFHAYAQTSKGRIGRAVDTILDLESWPRAYSQYLLAQSFRLQRQYAWSQLAP